jgi:hypothetical protein
VFDGEKLVVIGGCSQIHFLNVHALLITAVKGGVPATGAVNENSAHRLGSSSEKTSAVGCNVWPAASLAILCAARRRNSSYTSGNN